MSVVRNLPLVRERKSAIMEGDPDRVAEQRKLDKLTARERLSRLFDPSSFVEFDVMAGANGASGVVTGYGLVDGRPAYAYAQDYAQLGGAVGAEQARKVLKIMDLAAKTGSPVVALLDSKGARLAEGAKALDAYAQIAAKTAALSGVVPQVALVLGQCAASSAVIAEMSDIVVASEAARMYMNGPQVVSANKGEAVTAEQLGGADALSQTGLAHLTAKTDAEAVALARLILSYLPDNNLEEAAVDLTNADDMNRPLPEFDAIDKLEDMSSLVQRLADAGSYVELSAESAPGLLTALMRMGGRAVGVIANQPKENGGSLTAAGCEKAARFVRMLDCFNLPVVTVADTEGVEIACKCGQSRLIRACAQLFSALSEAAVARVALVAGKAVGAGYMTLASRSVADMVYAWPGAVIAPLDAPAAVQVLMKDRLTGAADPIARRAELEQEYMDDVADGVNAAKSGLVDDVIEPSMTRAMLCAALEMLASKREQRLPRKHANLPL